MPIVVTYDMEGAQPSEHNRLQSLFERFGWENLGGSSYRYPRLGTTDQPVEDWLNHIVPALMLFRCYAMGTAAQLVKFTLDVQSSSGYSQQTNFGSPPLTGTDMQATGRLYQPSNTSFGQQNLIDWLDETQYPYT